MAALATMLVRYRRFRHILIFERRDWPDRLIFALCLGIPLAAGVVARLLLNYDAADLTLEGAFLAGLIAGPYAGRDRRRAGRPAAARSPANSSRCPSPSAAASPAAACASSARRKRSGTSRRSSSPACRAASGRCCGRCRSTGRSCCCSRRSRSSCSRQALGARWSVHHRLFYLSPDAGSPVDDGRGRCSRPCCAVATPIKIWNNARIEHRLQEQEKLLLAAKIEALANQINPHFLFNTLTSISSLIRTQPETARMLITKLSGLLRRLMRSTDHFVTLREELESIDEYLDIEVVRFGPQLKVVKQISPDTLDVIVPSMILQPLVENSIKHGLARKIGGGRITITTTLRDGHAVIEVHDDGLGMTEERLEHALGERHRPEQRQRTAAHDLRRELPAEADEHARRGHVRERRNSRAGGAGTGHGVRWTLRAVARRRRAARAGRARLPARAARAASRSSGRPATASRRSRRSTGCSPTSSFSTCRCPG